MPLKLTTDRQAFEFTLKIASRFFAPDTAWVSFMQRVDPAVLPQAQAVLESFKTWSRLPTKSNLDSARREKDALFLRWMRYPVPDPLLQVLWILHWCELCTSQAWPTAVLHASTGARTYLREHGGSMCELEECRQQALDLATIIGSSVSDDYVNRQSGDGDAKLSAWWFGPALLSRPTKVLKLSSSGYRILLYEFPDFRRVELNGDPASFSTEREVLRAIHLISSWRTPLSLLSWDTLNIALSAEQVCVLAQDQGGSLSGTSRLVPCRAGQLHKGPALTGLPTRIFQHQNLWGEDEFEVDIWQNHCYRRLLINGLKAIFPTLQAAYDLIWYTTHLGSLPQECGTATCLILSAMQMAESHLPARMLLCQAGAGWKDLKCLEEEQRRRSGYLPATLSLAL